MVCVFGERLASVLHACLCATVKSKSMFKFHHIVNTRTLTYPNMPIWINQLMTSNIQAINIQRAPQVSTESDFINFCSFLLWLLLALPVFRHTKSVQRNITLINMLPSAPI